MQLTHQKNILAATDTIQKVTGLCWAANNSKLAAVTTDKVVHLFDEHGDKRDKFKTKSADANAQPSYVVRGMAFSPDSTKLAIAQSDNAVFVYRLGSDWSDKKSICNKFLTSSPVTCIAWPGERHNELVFGTADGKLRMGALKSNKAYTLYALPSGSYLVSLACSSDGRSVVAGHEDGSLVQYTFPAEEGAAGVQKQLAVHSCVPYALCWGRSVAAAGNDGKVVFYDPASGRVQQSFDHGSSSTEEEPRDFASGAASPAGDAMVFGSCHRLHMFTYSSQAGCWQAAGHRQVDNLYTVSQLSWRPDGSCVASGSLAGAVDLWEACLQRRRHKGVFELMHVSSSAVIVKSLQSGARTAIRSQSGAEITKVNIHEDRYVVARTAQSLLLADLQSCRLSEVGWPQQGGEKFYFGNDKVCLVYRAGELSLVEYGSNEVLASCRTDHASPYLLSVVLQEARGALPANRAAAYLVDAQTVRVLDLGSGTPLATINHDSRIDWLELNPRGSHLLFRDKRRHLHAYDIGSQQRATLLIYCQYVQWVPASDVVVAQSRGNMCIWYNVAQPDNVTMTAIRGDIEGIERADNRTTVQVLEGATAVLYDLDEALIGFGAALEAADYEGAAALLEPLALTHETEAQWRQLADAALAAGQAHVAQRCYAALGDACKTTFLRKLKKRADQGGGWETPQVRAQLAMLAQQWPAAEALLLGQGKPDEAIEMYKQLHRWEDAIRVADVARHPHAESLRRAHLQWLLETGQEGRAGAAKQAEGDHLAAISLYLRGGLPAKAAQVVLAAPGGASWDPALVESICTALAQAGLHERSGELLEARGRAQAALQAYRKGRGYRRAVDLARREFPALVVELEEEWGEWLMLQKQTDAAINHFIEAGQSLKAVEAAIRARQFGKAAGIIDFLEPQKALPYLKRIAQHYELAGGWAEAERCLVKAGLPLEAAEMHARGGRWDAAQKVARGYLSEAQARAFFSRRGRECEAQGMTKEAERAYVQAGELDAAISMYKKARQYDAMLRLVAEHRRDALPQAQLAAAQSLAMEGSRREAEQLFCKAGEWKAAVQMHRGAESWEDAMRVAKVYGGQGAAKQVAYAWAVTLGTEQGVQMLRRTGLLEAAVDCAAESGAFQHAFALATAAGLQSALPDIHLRHAMALEDEGRFAEAEQEFVLAGKPREAIDMYLHCQDWDAASRVAEQHDPPSMTDVLVAQAGAAAQQQQWQLAESVLLRARRPDLALKMYLDARLWQEALRVAENYLPARVQEVHAELAASMRAGGAGAGAGSMPAVPGAGDAVEAAVARARALERGNDHARAIDAYLSLGPGASSDLDALQRCWQQAVQLVLSFQRHRAAEVVGAAAARLAAIGRHEAAAEAHESIDDVRGALQVYCAAGLFDRARDLAAGDNALQRFVDEQQTAHLVAARNADGLAARGDAGSALELYAQQGEWGKVYELAGKQGSEALARYAAQHALVKLKQRDVAGAAAVLVERGVLADGSQLELYRRTALDVLALPQAQHDLAAEANAAQYLTRLVPLLEAAAASGSVRRQDAEDFRRLAAAARLASQASRSREAGLLELAARQRTALLRYTGIIPADKAFLDAGWAWKEARRPSMAFVLLNRYLDLIDAMEEPDSSAALIENSDFAGTDVPHDFPIPQRHYATEAVREEVRGYVLEISMDTQVEQTLSTVTCDSCGQQVYEAALQCPGCQARWEACVVSGYPASGGSRVCSRGGVVARREDWNVWVERFQCCPVTGAPEQPIY